MKFKTNLIYRVTAKRHLHQRTVGGAGQIPTKRKEASMEKRPFVIEVSPEMLAPPKKNQKKRSPHIGKMAAVLVVATVVCSLFGVVGAVANTSGSTTTTATTSDSQVCSGSTSSCTGSDPSCTTCSGTTASTCSGTTASTCSGTTASTCQRQRAHAQEPQRAHAQEPQRAHAQEPQRAHDIDVYELSSDGVRNVH